MGKTYHHGKYAKDELSPEKATKRRAIGDEYWGREGYMGEDMNAINRRRRRKWYDELDACLEEEE